MSNLIFILILYEGASSRRHAVLLPCYLTLYKVHTKMNLITFDIQNVFDPSKIIVE